MFLTDNSVAPRVAQTGSELVVETKDLLRIAWSGRGRMPIRIVESKEYATLSTGDVAIPEGLPSVSGPYPQYKFIRSVPLDALVKAVINVSAIE